MWREALLSCLMLNLEMVGLHDMINPKETFYWSCPYTPYMFYIPNNSFFMIKFIIIVF